jgi:hypothetical protein
MVRGELMRVTGGKIVFPFVIDICGIFDKKLKQNKNNFTAVFEI